MRETFGEALRRLRNARGLSLRRLGTLIQYDFRHLSDLEHGRRSASEDLARRCGRVLGGEDYLVALIRVGPVPAQAVAARPTRPAEADRFGAARWIDVGELVMAAAHESTDAAANDGGRVVPPATVEQVQADVERLAREYGRIPPLRFLSEGRRIRDLATRLADRTRRPAQIADLYLATGQVCALLSVASFDLAVWPAAIEQSRAAVVYAEMVNNTSLLGWARGVQALTAFWCGRASESVDLVDAGLEAAPAGTARARLHSIAARAWSHLDAAERTRAALADADAERQGIGETGTDDLHDRIAGEFGWGPGRQAMCSATALLNIGDADAAAERAEEAIRLRSSDHTGSLADITARVDLARAQLLRGQLDAATDALTSVWELAPEHRRFGVVGRLDQAAQLLADDPYRDSMRAGQMREQIEAFVADSAPRALPPGSTT